MADKLSPKITWKLQNLYVGFAHKEGLGLQGAPCNSWSTCQVVLHSS